MKKSINANGAIYNQSFDVQHTIDEKLKDPDLRLKIGENQYTLAEINNLVPSREKKLDIFIEWENMCQYFVFGILTEINELINGNRTIDVYSFVRRNEYPNAIDYLKNITFKDIDPNIIDMVIRRKYSNIMSKSPTTDFFVKLNLMKFMLNSVTFMFRYRVDGIDKLMKEISADKFNSEVECRAVFYESEEMEIEAIKSFPIKELYVVPDMGLYYKAFLDHNKQNTNILSYFKHNGVSPFILAYYHNEYQVNELAGPNDIILSFIKEYQFDENDIKEME